MNLVSHHPAITAILQKRIDLRAIAFCLECSTGELRRYAEENGLECEPEPVKQYRRYGAQWWKPWRVNPYDPNQRRK